MQNSRERLGDAARDLALGSGCVGCAAPGRVLCPGCDAALPRRGELSWPSPSPLGLAPPYAAGPYDGLLKALVNAHKEDGVLALAGPLGRVLSDVVHALLGELGELGELAEAHSRPPTGPVVLVPVPSRGTVVRRRGHDPLLRVAREASLRLRRHGVRAGVQQLLVASGRARDQSTLGASARAENLAGTMRHRRSVGRSVGRLVVVDDVLTTGSTAREAQRALETAGLTVTGVAAVAATRRRPTTAAGGTGAPGGGETFLPFSG